MNVPSAWRIAGGTAIEVHDISISISTSISAAVEASISISTNIIINTSTMSIITVVTGTC